MRWLVIFFFSSGCVLPATEYFVATGGDDSLSGTSREEAFATIGKGVSPLKPGDILTICPGEYFESITASVSGRKDAHVVIRAERPGTVIVRGDKPLEAGFVRAQGLKYTYVCEYEGEVKGVIERDSLSQYSPAVSADAADRVPGRYYYDKTAGRLYLHTSDSRNPARHDLTLSGLVGEQGLCVKNCMGYSRNSFMKAREEDWVKNVVIDGLAFTGFAQAASKGEIEGTGLKVFWPRGCVIRNCTAFLNGHGIVCNGTPIIRKRENALRRDRAENCIIEHCVAYGNADYGIVISGSVKDSAIRDCLTFKSSGHDIRFYSGVIENCTLRNNIAFMPGTLWIKANFRTERNNKVIGNVCNILDISSKESAKNNIAGRGAGNEKNIRTSITKETELAEHFADPLHLDYRLQSDSSYRGTGRAPYDYKDEVFFVGPGGDDRALGTSVKTAWKTLAQACKKAKAGQTVYLLPGRYEEILCPVNSGEKRNRLVFRKRGHGRVMVKGVDIKGKSFITIKGMTVQGRDREGISINGGDKIEIEQCVAAGCEKNGVYAENAPGLKITHCTFTSNRSGLELKKCENAVVAANIFGGNKNKELAVDEDTISTLWSDRNSFSSGLAEWRETTGLDLHSIELIPEFVDPVSGNFHLKNAYSFDGQGPLAMPIGPYEKIGRAATAKVDTPVVRSTTTTTANMECETPGVVSRVMLRWGTTPECTNSIGYGPEGLSHYFSLIGLNPKTEYYFRAEVAQTVPDGFFTNEQPQPAQEGGETVKSKVSSFTTPSTDSPARVYHVAAGGSDENDGLSEDKALRSINSAAAKIKAGDTVVVHDGTYTERVLVSATGDTNSPIVFRANNAGRALLKGKGIIGTGLELIHKSWVTIDGLYIADYGRVALRVTGGRNNTLRRSIFDGRTTYPSRLVIVSGENLTIENCVFRNAWNYLSVVSPNAVTIRNNVFYGAMCGGVGVGKSKCLLSHNIICDTVPKKRVVPLVYIHRYGKITDEYNCYFTRLPEEEKTLYWVRRRPEGRWTTFEQFKRESGGQGETSFFGNPGMKILKEYTIYTGDMTGKPHKYVTQELNYRDGKPVLALFDEYFATNPKCVKAADGRPIGLDPNAFGLQSGTRTESVVFPE